ncbi:hypothetical protein HYO65_gp181 [Tenacibaculum phage PTm1]|uniref:Uncharacterized protein n=2 Tax=Shirahamavirus PTm1 TaxID=2846435 RepID=A0A5S9EQN2_9CAUD|nr:hypothetical protein HYO65_gp181 [Tenacibaculum phage PTm1]BBI90573.1 hypothetical protein [Tenacibaculum phage PTm1]BBI90881.1 hypothetical protein [Tenacibaculum phage PTm5]
MRQNFTVALFDKNYNLFTKTNGLQKPVFKIPEHDTRLHEISEECHFYIDEEMYMTLDCQGVPFRYTKVFVDNPKQFTNNKYCTFYRKSDFVEQVKKYNTLYENKPLFFMGGSEFLSVALKLSNKLLVTYVDTSVSGAFDKFPLEQAKTFFTGRRKIEPTLLKEVRKHRKELRRKRKNQYEIAPNGMKVIKEVHSDKYTSDVLNIPDYMFYEYRR